MMSDLKNKIRLISLDVFRGLTIALMIIVNSPGNKTPYPILEHSAWHGCTLADLVFPFFIFILGLSLVFGLNKDAPFKQSLIKISKRTLIIFALGLFLNAFPYFDLEHLRIYGVLQRIAVCYFIGALLFLKTDTKSQALIFLFILVAYYLLMTLLTIPNEYFSLDNTNNLSSYFDRLIFSSNHLYGKTFDPEGLLSTLPSIATMLLGMLTATFLKSPLSHPQKLKNLIITGLILLFLGFTWSKIFPINKTLWTSSYVLWTGGLAMLIYALCYWLLEIKKVKRLNLFKLLGLNALTLYFLHVFFLKVQNLILITKDDSAENLRLFLSHALFGRLSPENASLAYALTYALLWVGLIILWQRKKNFALKQRHNYSIE